MMKMYQKLTGFIILLFFPLVIKAQAENHGVSSLLHDQELQKYYIQEVLEFEGVNKSQLAGKSIDFLKDQNIKTNLTIFSDSSKVSSTGFFHIEYESARNTTGRAVINFKTSFSFKDGKVKVYITDYNFGTQIAGTSNDIPIEHYFNTNIAMFGPNTRLYKGGQEKNEKMADLLATKTQQFIKRYRQFITGEGQEDW